MSSKIFFFKQFLPARPPKSFLTEGMLAFFPLPTVSAACDFIRSAKIEVWVHSSVRLMFILCVTPGSVLWGDVSTTYLYVCIHTTLQICDPSSCLHMWEAQGVMLRVGPRTTRWAPSGAVRSNTVVEPDTALPPAPLACVIGARWQLF